MSFVFKFTQLKLMTALIVIFGTLFSTLSIADEQSDRTFVVGVVSSKPVKAFERAQPLANYLAANLSQYGYSKGDVKVARNLRELERWLKRGQVDIFSETAFTAYELESSNLADILARHWKNGSAEYHSLFFARVDSNISSFDDLVDKIVTFEDRLSTSAYYLPATTLVNEGYRLSEVSSPREAPPKGTIGYFFADELSPMAMNPA
ncbi:PhnD/SsuA/transferrin family substrate-binding protein [Vibrio mexicanus]|uniref:PhnD/SsuA/transferrin family substrate-binding protein n=1 Tax=Vibrio mexicanus TaxID=1004326 RepID=UPI0009FD3AAC|nr:PhnD/SsuA/transferrin family substrate-binding protein [Vibrio mexicanus]